MSRKGNPYDDATAESFMKTLKYEEVYLWDYQTAEDVKKRIPYFLKEVYNQKRLHSALGYYPPNEYETAWQRGGTPLSTQHEIVAYRLVLVFLFKKVVPLGIEAYPAFVLSALLPWAWFGNCVASSSLLFSNHRDLVRRPNFELSTLVIVNTNDPIFG